MRTLGARIARNGKSRAAAAVLSVSAVAAGLVACGPVACPAAGYVSTMRLQITPERASSLAALDMRLCQDGSCRSVSLDAKALAAATPGYTSPAPVVAVPRHQADGSIDVTIEIPMNDHPLDLTTTGTDADGWSIGGNHVVLHPTTTYPHGRQCGGPTTATATLAPGPVGLRAG